MSDSAYTVDEAKAIAESALPHTAVLRNGLGAWAATVSAKELAAMLNQARLQGRSDCADSTGF